MSLRRLLAFATVAVLTVAACKSTEGNHATSVVVSPGNSTLVSLNQTLQFNAAVLDQNGDTMPGQTITWQSSNGAAATVSGTGLVTAVANGSTQLTAHAGTLSSTAVTVTVAQAAASITKISGDAQTDTVGQVLGTAITVQLTDGLGSPAAGVTVNFNVIFGGGNVSAPSGVTAANGRTSVTWTLGTLKGSQQLTATVTGGSPSTAFSATAVAGPPASVVIQAGDNQTAATGLTVTVDPAVFVKDQFNNGVTGASVTFVADSGGGSVTGGSQATNVNGVATVTSWTLGTAGTNTLVATVTGGGITGNPVTFHATAVTAGAADSVAVLAGQNQTGLIGYALNANPTVQVLDASQIPVSGAQVTFAIGVGGGSMVGPSVVSTGVDGKASVGWIIGGAPGANSLTATVTGGGIGGNPVTFNATGQAAAFNIDVRYIVAVSPAQHAGIDSAIARWQRLIYGDVPPLPVSIPANGCVQGQPALNESIDDIVIYVKLDSIDGPFNILGQAGPCARRLPSNIPIVGVMFFDTADVAPMIAAGQWDEVAMHEMGHALGYGTEWLNDGLLIGPTSQGGTDPHFVGTEALAAFDRSGGAGYSAGLKVPVENTGAATTRDAHWRESVFDTEVMTGFIDGGVPNPFSVISAASMADLGYLANYAASEAYTVANPLLVALQASRGPKIALGDDIFRGPVWLFDRTGHLVRVVPRK